MAGTDLDPWRQPVSTDAPAGEDLTYDLGRRAVFNLAKGRPATEWAPREDPDWGEVDRGCDWLLGRTRDVSVTLLKSVVLLQRVGLDGLADGLELLRDQLAGFWDAIHPRLDPDDGDPSRRINVLNALSVVVGQSGDVYRFRERIWDFPLTASPGPVQVTLRRLAAAGGAFDGVVYGADELPTPNDAAALDAAFAGTPTSHLIAVSESATRAAYAVDDIEAVVLGHLGDEFGPDVRLRGVRDLLLNVASTVDARIVPPAALGTS